MNTVFAEKNAHAIEANGSGIEPAVERIHQAERQEEPEDKLRSLQDGM